MKKILSLFLFFIILLSGCHRQKLETIVSDKVKIPVHVDWSTCQLTPQNVSMFFYNEKDGSFAFDHYFENNDKTVQSYVEVLPGEYTVVVFNEKPDQLKYISITDRKYLSTLCAAGVVESNAIKTSASAIYIYEPEDLASVIYRNLKITSEMIYYSNIDGWSTSESQLEPKLKETVNSLMDLVPLIKTSNLEFTIHLTGVNNLRMPVLINLKNLAGSYLFDKNSSGMDPVIYQYLVGDINYDEGSTTNGTIDGNINIFGILGDRLSIKKQPIEQPIIMEIKLILIDADKTLITREFDVTDKIEILQEETGKIKLKLNITDPEPLPNVVPDYSGDNDFSAKIVDWTEVDVPLNAE